MVDGGSDEGLGEVAGRDLPEVARRDAVGDQALETADQPAEDRVQLGGSVGVEGRSLAWRPSVAPSQ